eukprot:4577452-Pyramimonas_sp.AAC.1
MPHFALCGRLRAWQIGKKLDVDYYRAVSVRLSATRPDVPSRARRCILRFPVSCVFYVTLSAEGARCPSRALAVRLQLEIVRSVETTGHGFESNRVRSSSDHRTQHASESKSIRQCKRSRPDGTKAAKRHG